MPNTYYGHQYMLSSLEDAVSLLQQVNLHYSATLIIRTPLSKAPMLQYWISEIVPITEVPIFFHYFNMPWYETAFLLQRDLQKDS